MQEQITESLGRRIVLATSRRGSLLALAGAGLAVIAASPQAEAGNKRKDDKRCKRQVDQCNAYFEPLCDGEEARENCAQDIGACCAFLRECGAEAFIDCLLTLMRPTRPPEVP